ncbi:MAG: CaiB/BaiF CoA transferase family protein [Pseudomonadota bacterium]
MTTPLPLAGLTVVELGSNVAGPFGTAILAGLGAKVIKVERPEGDDARGWGPPFWHGVATIFAALNRAKRSVVVDLAQASELDRLKRFIVHEADVVLQNLRPGTVAKYGLDGPSLMRANPRLIYCNLHAFGAKGPLARRPGYDALVQAFGGIMSVTGEEGRPPVRCGISVIDMGTGMWCAIGVLAALARRAASGKGVIVDASLFETALAWMTFYAADALATGEAPTRHGSGVRGIAPYQAYLCADGYLIVAASNDRLFAKLAEALGRPAWLTDDRFRTNPARARHRAALNFEIEPILGARPRGHWQAVLDEAGIPNAPIQTMDAVLAHPQTKALDLLQTTAGGRFELIGLPLSFDGERPPLGPAAPALGADTEAVLGAAVLNPR